MAKLVDARDLKSLDPRSFQFDSGYGHCFNSNNLSRSNK